MYFLLLSHYGCGEQQKANYLLTEELKKGQQLERSKWDVSTKEEQGLIADAAACETQAAALALVQ